MDVTVGVATAVRFELPTGQFSDTVMVRAQAPVLTTEGAATGLTMEHLQLVSLPINGRDYARFSLLAPGAIARSNNIVDLLFNGLHAVHNQFSIEWHGIDATRIDQPYMANGYERGAPLLTGSLDTIEDSVCNRAVTPNMAARRAATSAL